MKPASPKKFNVQIYSEASDWLVEFRSGDVDSGGSEAFNTWLRTSPEHMRAYLELAAIWNEGSHLDPCRRFDGEDVLRESTSERNVVPLIEVGSSSPAWSGTSQGTERGGGVPDGVSETLLATVGRRCRAARPGSSRARWLAVAATVIVAILGVWALSERNTYITRAGEQRSIALSDGSTITLNVHSKIRVRFTADQRGIDLVDGQALFYVAKDTNRPFVVQTEDIKVRAVGTEFDVYRRKGGTTVTVIEGRVAVLPPPSASDTTPENSMTEPKHDKSATPIIGKHDPDPGRRAADPGSEVPGGDGQSQALPAGGPVALPGEFLLGAGNQAILTPQATVKPAQPDIEAAIAWTQQRLVFQSATLAGVAEEFNRYNLRQLVVDPNLAEFHITGVFATTNPDSLVRFLNARPGVMVTEKDGEIRISRKP